MDLESVLQSESKAIRDNLKAQEEALESMREPISAAGRLLRDALRKGGSVWIFGNGGSAADAQHMAAELSGRYMREREGLRAAALTTDTSVLTAVANDYGYDAVFARQVTALARPGDAAVGISTSGNSRNVLNGLAAARDRGCATLAVLGRDGGKISGIADVALVYPAQETPRIQEFHAVLVHLLCALVDAAEALPCKENEP